MMKPMTKENKNNRFVFVTCHYNMSKTLPQMLASIMCQSYTNWKVVITDDVSDIDQLNDAMTTVHNFNEFICYAKHIHKEDQYTNRIKLYANTEKKWETFNVLMMIKTSCLANDIVCRIDADDWLTDVDALACLNELYIRTPDLEALWTMHRWGFTNKNISSALPPGSDVYRHPWVSSHLKTFRKHLIDGMPYKNFTNMNDELVRRAGDQALYLPILFKSKKYGFVPRIMYHYSIDEQDGAIYLTDDAKFQKAEADFIRNRGFVDHGVTWEEKWWSHMNSKELG